jgi:hypothetical protein
LAEERIGRIPEFVAPEAAGVHDELAAEEPLGLRHEGPRPIEHAIHGLLVVGF